MKYNRKIIIGMLAAVLSCTAAGRISAAPLTITADSTGGAAGILNLSGLGGTAPSDAESVGTVSRARVVR